MEFQIIYDGFDFRSNHLHGDMWLKAANKTEAEMIAFTKVIKELEAKDMKRGLREITIWVKQQG